VLKTVIILRTLTIGKIAYMLN